MRICSEEKNEFIKTNSTNRDSFSRVHLLYIDSHNISSILPVYPEVKRIIVPDKLAVRANSVLKNVKIKWYVANTERCNPLKFFRKNNVVAWNFSVDPTINVPNVLEICEVVLGTREFMTLHQQTLDNWPGDFVLLKD